MGRERERAGSSQHGSGVRGVGGEEVRGGGLSHAPAAVIRPSRGDGCCGSGGAALGSHEKKQTSSGTGRGERKEGGQAAASRESRGGKQIGGDAGRGESAEGRAAVSRGEEGRIAGDDALEEGWAAAARIGQQGCRVGPEHTEGGRTERRGERRKKVDQIFVSTSFFLEVEKSKSKFPQMEIQCEHPTVVIDGDTEDLFSPPCGKERRENRRTPSLALRLSCCVRVAFNHPNQSPHSSPTTSPRPSSPRPHFPLRRGRRSVRSGEYPPPAPPPVDSIRGARSPAALSRHDLSLPLLPGFAAAACAARGGRGGSKARRWPGARSSWSTP
jgi:hypothetical protein